jgi:hypothetical protein
VDLKKKYFLSFVVFFLLPKIYLKAIHNDGGKRKCLGKSFGKYSKKNSLLHDNISSNSISLIADCDELI